MAISRFNGVSEFANQYDIFFLDLWGVIHDGMDAYDGAAECLDQLRKAGKTIIFISNAPRRATEAKRSLDRVNIDAALYDHVISSGEITFEHVKANHHNYGSSYYIIGPDKDDAIISELEHLTIVDDPEKADFVIATGFDHDDSTIDELLPIIDKIKQLDLPMICANPDKIIVRKTGKIALCAGVITDHYESQGGKVIKFGKPYNAIFNKALELCGSNDLSKICMVGDNLETDIKGANEVGIDSILIPGGVLAKDLNISHGELPDQKVLEQLCQKLEITPKAVLASFIW